MVYIRINVPPEIASEPRRNLADFLKNHYPKQIASAQGGVIDPTAADNEAVRTQNQWIELYNAQGEEFKGKRMISAPDVYMIGKNGIPELVQSVRDDFEKRWLVTSTREKYRQDTLDARITHNHGSTVVQPTEKIILVPVYRGTPLDQVLRTEEGIAYLRIKFDTNDSPEDIGRTLAALSGKPSNLTYIWTPDQASRATYQGRAAGFDSVNGRFHVYGGYRVVGYGGLSRGVSVKSAKPPRKNRA